VKAVDARKIHEGYKEAVVDALLNSLTARLSGSGDFGRLVYATKPRSVFSTAFLLPKPIRERVGDEEASPIQISAHGLDFQVAAQAATNPIVATASAAAYVRVYPKAEEMRPGAACYPTFPVTSEVKRRLKAEIRDRLSQVIADLGGGDRAKARKHSDWVKRSIEARKAAHLTVGLPFGDEVDDRAPEDTQSPVLGDPTEVPADPDQEASDEETPGGAAGPAADVLVRSAIPDSHAQPIAPPQKWLRIDLELPSLTFTCNTTERDVAAANVALRQSIQRQLMAWRDSTDPESGGAMWGFRRFRNIRPSDVADWNRYLGEARASKLLPVLPEFDIRWVVEVHDDPIDPSRKSIHVALENWSEEPSITQFRHSEEALFQTSVVARLRADIHRPLHLDRVEPSYRYNEYLSYPALGFNGGVFSERSGEDVLLRTTWWPRYVQPRIIPTQLGSKGVKSSMEQLAREDSVNGVKPLVNVYEEWLDLVRMHPYQRGIDPSRTDLIKQEERKLQDDIAAWGRELAAIREGVGLLEESRLYWSGPGPQKDIRGTPFEAWSAMNEAMARLGERKGYSEWRLFQLAFILANLPGFATRIPEFQKRYTAEVADYSNAVSLLYFATGGGKSEAFLGLLVFVLLLDRLRGKECGVSAMLRYPLRLLTLQQAQRTAKTLAQAELVRVRRRHPGEPLSLGFWVGSGNTPNWFRDLEGSGIPAVEEAPAAAEAALLDQTNYKRSLEQWRKLPECPFCASERGTGLRRFSEQGGLLGHLCLNEKCAWNRAQSKPRALPFLVVDEDIYDLAPSVLLGTVDKLSAIGQSQGTIRKFFGMFGFAPWFEPATGRLHVPADREWKVGPGSRYVPLFPTYSDGQKRFFDPYPSLLIQDEAHLLDESLGTFAGLFETALDAALDDLAPLLSELLPLDPITRSRRRIKVIAASATVNEPERQMRSLYQRDRTVQFPYPGPELYRSFYAEPKGPGSGPEDTERRAIPEQDIERRSHWGRVYQSILTNGRSHTSTMVSTLANYHLIVTELYEALRSGDPARHAAARQSLKANLSPGVHREQFARLIDECGPDALLTLVDLHRISLTYVTNKKGGDQIIDAERTEFEKLHDAAGFGGHMLISDLITGAIDAAQIQAVVRKAETKPMPGERFPELNDTLRSVIATSAVSHGVDVEELNAMFFAGMPSDIAEYIQASSRIGRTHVGFAILVPTPQRARDRYIVEVHDIFHRFLERMILPASVDRWAEKALVRVVPSFFQAFVCAVKAITELAQASDPNKARQGEMSYRMVSQVRDFINQDPRTEKTAITDFIRRAIGLKPGFTPEGGDAYSKVIVAEVDSIHNSLEDGRFRGSDLRYFFTARDIRLRPMTSLRDVDEPGYIVPSDREADDRSRLRDGALEQVMRLIRRGAGADIADSLADEDEGR
jgi:hypothetical protein